MAAHNAWYAGARINSVVAQLIKWMLKDRKT
jgi:hypothetical protein